MDLPANLLGLSEEQLVKYIDATKQEMCRLEQEILADLCAEHEEESAQGSSDNGKDCSNSEGEVSASEAAVAADADAAAASGATANDDNPAQSGEADQATANAKTSAAPKEEDPADEATVPQLEVWKPPRRCVPIRADVRTFDFRKLAQTQRRKTGKLFDVIMTDPPWQLATSNPTRGVAIGYKQLSDSLIEKIPFPSLQENGFLFVWVINAKYKFALELMEKWGYTLVDEIAWVKQTVNRRLAKSHGFYLQHAKETCLVGKKGDVDPLGTRRNIASDVLYCERQGQSQKPVEIYEIIEELVPGGSYLEIFARRNNLRDNWVSVGNEL
ncbi:N6-adenosine-methyltransferase subunit METTL3 [Hondaea fermentalgiana]|uniref:mRNA m(6)A methyltransferase n=1 Tax=Hondaea fermentalgiana TaxID=2315210 RepID=A0A2R5GJX7_9STRA|nr:N6-adenosine-methyltransferase subunit METTL3 [Hondaea fermentalgiana]|eukprot:GBG31206.1 N6-adenosine-methyltransferase subunit METTL3 [Hondaea fermentalgiana]